MQEEKERIYVLTPHYFLSLPLVLTQPCFSSYIIQMLKETAGAQSPRGYWFSPVGTQRSDLFCPAGTTVPSFSISADWWEWQHQQRGPSPWGLWKPFQANFLSKQNQCPLPGSHVTPFIEKSNVLDPHTLRLSFSTWSQAHSSVSILCVLFFNFTHPPLSSEDPFPSHNPGCVPNSQNHLLWTPRSSLTLSFHHLICADFLWPNAEMFCCISVFHQLVHILPSLCLAMPLRDQTIHLDYLSDAPLIGLQLLDIWGQLPDFTIINST